LLAKIKALAMLVAVFFNLGGEPAVPPPEPPAKAEVAMAVAVAPKPSAIEAARAEVRQAVSVHRPYAELRCLSCHQDAQGNGLLEPVNVLCMRHHRFGGKSHPMPGDMTCLTCHRPHTSDWPELLTQRKNLLCLSCHPIDRPDLQNLPDLVSASR